jgi:demethylmenaquinone methyltransferase/2-methoxy-6-polyprenyl-1,4-benzoquinol methylase
MPRFDHFNLLGPIYDLIFGLKKDNKIVDLVDVQNNHMLLDIGGGTGRVTVLFEQKSIIAVVVDSALEMLRKAQSKGLESCHSQSEFLPFADDSFDRIIMVDALHHVKKQTQTLNEMWRVLSPGGVIVIEEPDIHNFFVKLVAFGEKLLLMRSHFIKPNKIAELCRFDKNAKVEIYKDKGIAWIKISKILDHNQKQHQPG